MSGKKVRRVVGGYYWRQEISKLIALVNEAGEIVNDIAASLGETAELQTDPNAAQWAMDKRQIAVDVLRLHAQMLNTLNDLVNYQERQAESELSELTGQIRSLLEILGGNDDAGLQAIKLLEEREK